MREKTELDAFVDLDIVKNKFKFVMYVTIDDNQIFSKKVDIDLILNEFIENQKLFENKTSSEIKEHLTALMAKIDAKLTEF